MEATMRRKHLVLHAAVLLGLLAMWPSFALAGGDAGDVIGGLLITLLVIVVLFLIFREVVCWYWKINARLAKMDKSIALLESMDATLKEIRSATSQNAKTAG